MSLYRLCTAPGCDELTLGKRCQVHIREVDRKRGTSAQRGYNDGDWRRIRKLILGRDNYECQLRRRGCTRVATAVDHIIPLSRGGARLDPANLRASCSFCNTGRGARYDPLEASR